VRIPTPRLNGAERFAYGLAVNGFVAAVAQVRATSFTADAVERVAAVSRDASSRGAPFGAVSNEDAR